MIRIHHGRAAGQVGRGDADQRLADPRRLNRAGLFNGLDPHIKADISGLHRVIGDALLVLDERQPVIDKRLVLGGVIAHKIIPRGQMPHQRPGVNAGQFFLANREGHDRDVLGRDALIGELLVKRHIGVAVHGGHHGGLFAGRAEFFDVGHDALPVGMAKRGIVDHDVPGLKTPGLEIGLQDLVGGARIDIIRAGQHPALDADLIHQIIHSGDGLLIRRRARVKHIL